LAKIVIVEGPDAGKEFTVEQAAILGRLDTNDIPVRDTKASREHAKIYRQGAKYAVVDLNSSNGTFVNGSKVTKHQLEPGDEIQIGVVVLRFEDPESEAENAAASSQRQSLDDAFAGRSAESTGTAAAAAAGSKPADVVLAGHKPIQYRRVKPGRTLGIDFDQMSDTARFFMYIGLILVFAVVIWLAYSLV